MLLGLCLFCISVKDHSKDLNVLTNPGISLIWTLGEAMYQKMEIGELFL